jgi:glycosyltransferase involved in cell wall biosynthesis
MNTSARILQIANQAGPLYLFMLPLCRALRQAGAEVELACTPEGALWEPLNQLDFKVHELPAGSWSKPSTWLMIYRKMRLLLRAGEFDLMIVCTPAMSWVARRAARSLVPASIYFAHGLAFAPEQPRLTHLAFRCIEQFMARYTDAVIVVNSDDAAACQRFKLTRCDGRCYHVPGPGVDVDAFASRPAEHLITKLEHKLGLRAGKPMVLFLGRFIKAKRPGDVLELARRLDPEVDFVMAGEGPLWKQIKEAGARIGPHVKVIEFTEQVPLLLARCSLFVLPSVFREGLPQTLLEAHAAGKPAVAYDVRGPRDIIEHGTTGYLVQPCNIDELHEAVRNVLKDDNLRDKMGRAGQKRIREKFSTNAALSAIVPAVCEVLRNKKICDLQYRGEIGYGTE